MGSTAPAPGATSSSGGTTRSSVAPPVDLAPPDRVSTSGSSDTMRSSRSSTRTRSSGESVGSNGVVVMISVVPPAPGYNAGMAQNITPGRSGRLTLPTPPTGLPVGSFDTYEAAQRAVDYLSDEKFPVEGVTIVGSDLQLVERVTGRLTYGRSAAAGAASGAWFGALVGLLLGVFASHQDSTFALLLSGILYGAVFGAVFGLISFAATGGRRDFTSATQVVAKRYDVLCDSRTAEEARQHLARLSLRS